MIVKDELQRGNLTQIYPINVSLFKRLGEATTWDKEKDYP